MAREFSSSENIMENLLQEENDKPVRPTIKYALIISGAVPLVIGLAGILGLYFGITGLTSIWPGDKPIALSAALTWGFFGLVLLIRARRPLSGIWQMLVGALLAFIAVSSALEFPLNLMGRHFLIENLINSGAAPYMAGSLTPVSPVASFLFILLAVDLFQLNFTPENIPRHQRDLSVISLIGLFCSTIGFIFVMSYLYGLPFLYGSAIIPIAFMSALGALFAGTGLMAAAGPGAFPLVYFFGSSTRARLLRIFFPLVIALVLLQSVLSFVLVSIFQVHQAVELAISLVLFCLLTSWGVKIAAESIGQVIDREKEMKNQAEENLRKTTEYLQNLLNYANAPIIVWDPEFRITRFNHAFERLTGRTEQEVIGQNLSILFPEASRESSLDLIKKTLAGERWETVEIPILNVSGEIRIALWNSANLVNPDGTIISTIAQGQDITERKLVESEREKLIKDLEQKNAELERFTYTVSHDLKSPLITIHGFTDLLGEDIQKNDSAMVARDIERINAATQKMETLLKDLLNLSRIGRIVNPPEKVPFSEIAREAMGLLEIPLRKGGVNVSIDPDMPTVNVDQVRVREVLTNLVENAIKFMGDQTHPEIHIGFEYDGGSPVFFVRDNGIGIDPKYHERIFKLFEKLDPKKEGSGAGLAIVKRIIEVHGGKIWVESKGNGSGSTFLFTLPGATDISGDTR